MNKYACPGWSFYEHARDVSGDKTAMMVVEKSEAPYWAVAEWLDFGVTTEADWLTGFRNAFALPRMRYFQIRHWGSIEKKPDIGSASGRERMWQYGEISVVALS